MNWKVVALILIVVGILISTGFKFDYHLTNAPTPNRVD